MTDPRHPEQASHARPSPATAHSLDQINGDRRGKTFGTPAGSAAPTGSSRPRTGSP
jgi:hypothetical protein